MYMKIISISLLLIFILSSCGVNNSNNSKNLTEKNDKSTIEKTTEKNTETTTETTTEISTTSPSIPETSKKQKFTEILNSYTTEFDNNKTNRVYNIKKASKILSGTIVESGEEFSFNSVVGATGEKEGYKKAITYVNGKEEENYGGGVCQISTTLLNALYPLDIEVTEQHHHSLPVPYVEEGKDASVSYGSIDFKFINNNSYPIQINATVGEGKITVDIFKVEYK